MHIHPMPIHNPRPPPSTSQSSLTHVPHSTPFNTFTPQRATPEYTPHQPQPDRPATPSVTTLPPMKLPKTPEGWAEANLFMKNNVIQAVFMQSSVDVMDHALCEGIYSFFTSRYGTTPTNQQHQLPKKAPKQQTDLKNVQIEKKEVKKRLKQLRRSGNSPEEVRLLAQTFHGLVRKHSKLSKMAKCAEGRLSQSKQRKECHNDLQKFARKILADESFTGIEAESHFINTYASAPKSFTPPSWMPEAPSPTTPLVTCEFTEEEVEKVIARSKTSSTPSPLDQIPYIVLKKCPSLMPALLHLFNKCWSSKCVPQAWKVGVTRLLGKKKAEADPCQPSNFRPIALTSCIGKVFTSVLKQRWMKYMLDNRYLNTTVQKAFVDGVPRCTQHHLKLLSTINEARRKHKSLCVCWLDLANAFGRIHHDLIRFSFSHYHALAAMTSMLSNLYQDLTGVVSTKSWLTDPIHLQIGVYQGDPLSVLVFNTVMNTLVDTITKCHPDLGYHLSSSSVKSNLLQYADDTSLVDGPSSCKAMLTTTEAWLKWSGTKANVPKCMSLAIRVSSGKPYDPKLMLNEEAVPYFGDSTFHFLGAPVSLHNTSMQARESLLA